MTAGRREAGTSTWLDGVWVREARSVDGGPFFECTDVHWLQVGPWFADVRVPRPRHTVSHPLDLAQGFSGVVDTNGSTVTWTHDLDTMDRPSGHRDTGYTRFDDGVLVEWEEGYEEHWRPIAPDDAPATVLECRVGSNDPVWARVVRVGTLAAAVWAGDRPGAALLSEERGWQATLTVGPSDGIGGIRAALSAEACARPLPPGWRRLDRPGGGVAR
jgi:hypothetical protein